MTRTRRPLARSGMALRLGVGRVEGSARHHGRRAGRLHARAVLARRARRHGGRRTGGGPATGAVPRRDPGRRRRAPSRRAARRRGGRRSRSPNSRCRDRCSTSPGCAPAARSSKASPVPWTWPTPPASCRAPLGPPSSSRCTTWRGRTRRIATPVRATACCGAASTSPATQPHSSSRRVRPAGAISRSTASMPPVCASSRSASTSRGRPRPRSPTCAAPTGCRRASCCSSARWSRARTWRGWPPR